jgi:hypothetical protein
MRPRIVAMVAMVAMVAVAGAAWAVKPGGELYVKARNTKVFKSASLTAPVVEILQPGEKVIWHGPDAKKRELHRVEFKGVKGFVFQTALSTQPPKAELLSARGSTPVDPADFVSSGAATKGLTESAVAYGKKQKMETSVDQVLTLEALAERVGPEAVAEHVKKARLFPVVGTERSGAVAGGGR